MEINKEDIIGTYILNDGCKYIFLKNRKVYKEDLKGNLTEVDISNQKQLEEDIGDLGTDFIR